MAKSTFAYCIYIQVTPERLWRALTEPELTRRYWFGMHIETTWQVGAPWRLVFPDGRLADSGQVLTVDAPYRLTLRWHNEWKPEMREEGDSVCHLVLEEEEGVVKLLVSHEMDREASAFIEAVAWGWPRILSNLKSLLETGEPIFPQAQ
ncbi:ATPase [Chromobacterium sp. ATCC 53434]|uniref:SRPBCC family protein n=1 Tax=Chromobacterium TaxID=535 RepID=UPI000C7582C2|nr:SRPBCC family protein [Chromobacterium sp. ATCC 53434]AUH51055.1 ATPase [Chromobacterium sp. ATCC 53434]